MKINTIETYSEQQKFISQSFAWKDSAIDLDLNSRSIHIWVIDLDINYTFNESTDCIFPDEYQRAERLLSKERRIYFERSRCTLRNILGFYTHQSPDKIRFKYWPEGKPYLDNLPKGGQIEFNISHTKNLMVAVFTLDNAVGIDLEHLDAVKEKDWIVNNYFSDNDQYFFNKLPENQKDTAFINAWTKREAFGKAIGQGFASGVRLDCFDEPSTELIGSNLYDVSFQDNFWFIRFSPQESFTTTVAVQSEEMPETTFYKLSEEFAIA